MDEEEPQSAVMYLSYLLRLWRTGEDNPWKASLEDPRTGQRTGFQSLELLLAYLREQTGEHHAPSSIDSGITQ